MYVLKLIFLTTFDLLKQAWSFPHSLVTAVQHRRRNVALNALEAERLDRIRNPSKYLGSDL